MVELPWLPDSSCFSEGAAVNEALLGLRSVFPSGLLLSFCLCKDEGVPQQGGCIVWLLWLCPCTVQKEPDTEAGVGVLAL